MELIQHTNNWIKGEITESIITASIGLLVLIGSFLFWKFGNTPYARALIVPLFVVGIIPLVMGISGTYSNYKSIPVYEQSWKTDKQQFIKSEKQRVEGFDNIFKYTYPMAIMLVVAGAIMFFVLGSANWKAISLAMMTMGLMAYYIDHFAKERADIYYEFIRQELVE